MGQKEKGRKFTENSKKKRERDKKRMDLKRKVLQASIETCQGVYKIKERSHRRKTKKGGGEGGRRGNEKERETVKDRNHQSVKRPLTRGNKKSRDTFRLKERDILKQKK